MNQSKKEITLRDQRKKFGIKNLVGFYTVLVYGLGSKLGIFNYLYEKGKSERDENSINPYVSFKPNEMAKNLGLDERYLEIWLHMANECGIFELDDPIKKTLKTAPYVYDILINPLSMNYSGGLISMMGANAAIQSMLEKNFKTGEVFQTFGGTQFTQIPCYGESKQLISLFSNRCDKKKQEKINEGTILEVGCGYGYTLTSWAEFYDKARIVGIDIDAFAIEYTEKLISQRKWDDRIEVSTIQIEKFAPSNENKFDLILLMQVLHEMNHEGEYRNNVFDNIYKMLKDDGVFIVKEHMIPDLFQPKPNRTVFFDVWHEYFEIAFNVSFYSEQSFREFIETTPFKYAKFIQERSNYFWVLAKKKEILELFK